MVFFNPSPPSTTPIDLLRTHWADWVEWQDLLKRLAGPPAGMFCSCWLGSKVK